MEPQGLLLEPLPLAGKETMNRNGFRQFITCSGHESKIRMVFAPNGPSPRESFEPKKPYVRDSASWIFSTEKTPLSYSEFFKPIQNLTAIA